MATHSSTLAWKIPWTEEPGTLQSVGSHRVGHDWSDLAAAAAMLTSFGYVEPKEEVPVQLRAISQRLLLTPKPDELGCTQ